MHYSIPDRRLTHKPKNTIKLHTVKAMVVVQAPVGAGVRWQGLSRERSLICSY